MCWKHLKKSLGSTKPNAVERQTLISYCFTKFLVWETINKTQFKKLNCCFLQGGFGKAKNSATASNNTGTTWMLTSYADYNFTNMFSIEKNSNKTTKKKKGWKLCAKKRVFFHCLVVFIATKRNHILLWAIYGQRLNWVRQIIFNLFSCSERCMRADSR